MQSNCEYKYCINFGRRTNVIDINWLYTSWLAELIDLIRPQQNTLNDVLQNEAMSNAISEKLFDKNKSLKDNVESVIKLYNYDITPNDEENIKIVGQIYKKEFQYIL